MRYRLSTLFFIVSYSCAFSAAPVFVSVVTALLLISSLLCGAIMLIPIDRWMERIVHARTNRRAD